MKHIVSNMLQKNFKSTFMSCAKDQETIWRRLLVESKPYSDKLKKLLIINTPNCLDSTQAQYQQKINEYTIKRMKDEQYIKSIPKLIISQLDYWELDDYELRPWLIAGYIDGILNETKLSGIGTLQFMGVSQVVLNEYLGGVILRYVATHSDADDSERIIQSLPAPQNL